MALTKRIGTQKNALNKDRNPLTRPLKRIGTLFKKAFKKDRNPFKRPFRKDRNPLKKAFAKDRYNVFLAEDQMRRPRIFTDLPSPRAEVLPWLLKKALRKDRVS